MSAEVVRLFADLDPFESGITIEECRRRIRIAGGRITDAPVVDHATFRGWAKAAFDGRVAHYWMPLNAAARAEQIVRGVPEIFEGARVYAFAAQCRPAALLTFPHKGVPLFLPGNFPRCQHCQRIAKRWHLR